MTASLDGAVHLQALELRHDEHDPVRELPRQRPDGGAGPGGSDRARPRRRPRAARQPAREGPGRGAGPRDPHRELQVPRAQGSQRRVRARRLRPLLHLPFRGAVPRHERQPAGRHELPGPRPACLGHRQPRARWHRHRQGGRRRRPRDLRRVPLPDPFDDLPRRRPGRLSAPRQLRPERHRRREHDRSGGDRRVGPDGQDVHADLSRSAPRSEGLLTLPAPADARPRALPTGWI